MSSTPKGFSAGRRSLLAAAGSAALLASPLTTAASLSQAGAALRVGLLLPQSRRYPGLGSQLLGGFRAFTASAHGINVLPIACKTGARAPFIAAAAAIEAGGLDLLAGFGDRNLATQLAPALEARGVPFLVNDLGADIVRAGRDNPWIVRNSLGYWQANHSMGAWTAANLGRRVLVAADFLESGYDMVYAFRHGFEAEGGEVLDVQVTGLPDGPDGFEAVASAIRLQRPDFVYAFHSGPRAAAFLRFYAQEGLAAIAALAGAGMLAEGAAAFAPGDAPDGVITVSPWSHDLDSAANTALRTHCRSARCTEPGLFTVLGYESAQRIAAALHSGHPRGAALARALAAAAYDGPRGPVSPDAALADTRVPAYVRRLTRGAAGYSNTTIAHLAPAAIAPEVRRELRAMVKSGWTHAYLAA